MASFRGCCIYGFHSRACATNIQVTGKGIQHSGSQDFYRRTLPRTPIGTLWIDWPRIHQQYSYGLYWTQHHTWIPVLGQLASLPWTKSERKKSQNANAFVAEKVSLTRRQWTSPAGLMDSRKISQDPQSLVMTVQAGRLVHRHHCLLELFQHGSPYSYVLSPEIITSQGFMNQGNILRSIMIISHRTGAFSNFLETPGWTTPIRQGPLQSSGFTSLLDLLSMVPTLGSSKSTWPVSSSPALHFTRFDFCPYCAFVCLYVILMGISGLWNSLLRYAYSFYRMDPWMEVCLLR
ncbi:hypothetical protein F4776DRAFT_73059 [Hypoxylon sp. NC0597]|nr:hypothetical protein F4776DRAFT_73059 [Hypoxylon sp. NC0597]